MAVMGVPSDIRSRVLHHTGDVRAALINSTYSTYEFLGEKRRALTLWAGRLRAIIEDRKMPTERYGDPSEAERRRIFGLS